MLNAKYQIKGSSGFLIMFGTVAFLCMFSACASAEKSSPTDWPAQTKECRPWTYRWWRGSAVDEPNLTETLEVEVTNLSANKVAGMKKINGVRYNASNWTPMDSGLFGPVRLIASELIKPNER